MSVTLAFTKIYKIGIEGSAIRVALNLKPNGKRRALIFSLRNSDSIDASKLIESLSPNHFTTNSIKISSSGHFDPNDTTTATMLHKSTHGASLIDFGDTPLSQSQSLQEDNRISSLSTTNLLDLISPDDPLIDLSDTSITNTTTTPTLYNNSSTPPSSTTIPPSSTTTPPSTPFYISSSIHFSLSAPPGICDTMLNDRLEFSEDYLSSQIVLEEKWMKYFNIYGDPDSCLIKDIRIRRLICQGIPDKYRGKNRSIHRITSILSYIVHRLSIPFLHILLY